MKQFFSYIFVAGILLAAVLKPAAAGEIVFAVSDWRPMAYQDETGQARGLLVEIAREVMEKEMGLDLAVRFLPWKRAQKEVEFGKSDFLITVPTKARKAYAAVSGQVFYRLPLHIYTWAGHPKRREIDAIRTAEDIKRLNLVPVTNLGNGWHREQVDAQGIETHYAGKEENILFLLAYKRADIVIDAVVPTNYLIRKYGLNRKVELTRSRFSQVEFHLLMGKRSGFAGRMPLFDAAFERARQRGAIRAIAERYEDPASLDLP